jgi:hypothetical protein
MASHPQELWGDLKPVVSVKELMRDYSDRAQGRLGSSGWNRELELHRSLTQNAEHQDVQRSRSAV